MQGYKTLKFQGKNKTQLLPSDWDDEEEYICNDNYKDEDKDVKDDKDKIKTFDEVNKNEVDDLTNNNNNNNNNVAEADGNNIVVNPEQNEEIVVKDVNNDNENENSNENHAKNAETDNKVKN